MTDFLYFGHWEVIKYPKYLSIERLFLAVPQGCLRFVIVVFPDHTHLLILVTVYTALNPRHRRTSTIVIESVSKIFFWQKKNTNRRFSAIVFHLPLHKF